MVERGRLASVVEEVNRMVRDRDGVVFELWRWEVDARPQLDPEGPQGVILPELDEADVVIVLAWNRFRPGVREEVSRAHRRWEETGAPRVMAYFSTSPSVLHTEEECDERKDVLRARAWFLEHGLYRSYAGPDELEKWVRTDLMRVAGELR